MGKKFRIVYASLTHTQGEGITQGHRSTRGDLRILPMIHNM